MALITCSDCSTQYADDAPYCPNCGKPNPARQPVSSVFDGPADKPGGGSGSAPPESTAPPSTGGSAFDPPSTPGAGAGAGAGAGDTGAAGGSVPPSSPGWSAPPSGGAGGAAAGGGAPGGAPSGGAPGWGAPGAGGSGAGAGAPGGGAPGWGGAPAGGAPGGQAGYGGTPGYTGAPAPGGGQEIPNYLVQSILVTVLSCCTCFIPIGAIALIFSIQVNSKRDSGDIAGAMVASKNAKMACWVVLGVCVVSFVIGMIFGLLGMIGNMVNSQG